mgnify:CR=1 FL=1
MFTSPKRNLINTILTPSYHKMPTQVYILIEEVFYVWTNIKFISAKYVIFW